MFRLNGVFRKFWLTNGAGQRYDLTNLDENIPLNAFFNNPKGLGSVSEISSVRVGNSQVVNGLSWQFIDISGDVILPTDGKNATPYSRYRNFISFCSKQPLEMHYQTPDNSGGSYSRQVILSSVEKAEIEPEGFTLVVPCIFSPLEFWKDSEASEILITTEVPLGKSYPLKRQYAYAAGGLDGTSLTSLSDTSIPIEVNIVGNATNPTWSIYDSDNALYGRARIIGTYDEVLVNSSDLEEDIKLRVGASFIPNAVAKQDITVGVPNSVKATYLYLAPGRSTITFALGAGFDGYVTVRYRNQYATV